MGLVELIEPHTVNVFLMKDKLNEIFTKTAALVQR